MVERDQLPGGGDAAYRKIFWRLMPYLMLCFVISFVNRSNIGIAKLQFTQDLGFSEAAYGFGAGIFFLGNILFEIPSQVYLVRVGVRPTLTRIMILWGFTSAAMGFMKNAGHFYALRFLLGGAEAGFQPGVLFYLTRWVPPHRRARFTAFFMASIPISGIIGGPLGGSIMRAIPDWLGLKGWQWLFIIEGLPAVLLGGLACYVLKETPADAPWLSIRDKAVVGADLDRDRQSRVGHQVHENLSAGLKDPRLYIVAMLGLGLTVSTSSIYIWLPTIIRNAGLKNVFDIGVLSAVPFLVGLVTQILIAWSSDRMHERRWHSAVPAFVAAAGWCALPCWTDSPTMAMTCITLAAAGTFGAMGPYWTLPTIFLSGPASAVGLAVILLIGNLGSFVGQSGVGWLVTATGSLSIGLYYFGSLMLIGGLCTLSLKKLPEGRPWANRKIRQ